MGSPRFGPAVVAENEGVLGQVQTVYRVGPPLSAWDTPNLTSSRFASVTTAIPAAFTAMPIGTVLFEDAPAYTYDGAAEDVEVLEPGLYAIEGSAQVKRTGGNPTVFVAIGKNGSVIAPGVSAEQQLANLIDDTITNTPPTTIQLAVGDKLSLMCREPGSGSADCVRAFLKITKLRILA